MAYVETVNQLGNMKFRQFFRFGLLMMNRRLNPAITPNIDDIQKENESLQKPGVVFSMISTTMGPVTIVVFDDIRGNNIQLVQV